MIIFSVDCHNCSTNHLIIVPDEDWLIYEYGASLDQAFPYMCRETRELLISQTCPTCYEVMHNGQEKEDPTSS